MCLTHITKRIAKPRRTVRLGWKYWVELETGKVRSGVRYTLLNFGWNKRQGAGEPALDTDANRKDYECGFHQYAQRPRYYHERRYKKGYRRCFAAFTRTIGTQDRRGVIVSDMVYIPHPKYQKLPARILRLRAHRDLTAWLKEHKEQAGQ